MALLPVQDSDDGLPNRADMLAVTDVAYAVVFVATRPDGVAVPVLQVEPVARRS